MFTAIFFGIGGSGVIKNAIAGIGLGPGATLALFLIAVFVSGIFLDWLGVILIIVPIFMPIIAEFGFDPLHIGIVVLVLLQTSFLTPPFAYSIFYVAGVSPPGVTIADIYKGVIPFILIQIIVVMICIFFPAVVTVLPNLMYSGI